MAVPARLPTATEYIRNFIEVQRSSPSKGATVNDSPPWDVRVSILGHLQRGGPTSAFDRILASRMGAKAVECIDSGNATVTPQMMSLKCGKIEYQPTQKVIKGVKGHQTAIEKATLQRYMELVRDLSRIPQPQDLRKNAQTLGILTAGADSPGMNMALRAVARIARNKFKTKTRGYIAGFQGLIDGTSKDLTWEGFFDILPDPNAMKVDAHRRAGSLLGTRREEVAFSDDHLSRIQQTIKNDGLSGLIVVGGPNSAERALELDQHLRKAGSASAFPIIVIPASIDHGMPGTHATLGYDSALNEIVSSCDQIIDTGQANERVSIVETMGGDMGALALPGALACGAELALVPESCSSHSDAIIALRLLADKMLKYTSPRKYATILVKDDLCPGYSTKRILGNAEAIFRESEVRVTELGYTQRGGRTSYYDRVLGTLMGVRAVEEFQRMKSEIKPPSIILQRWAGELKYSELELALKDWVGSPDRRREQAKELWGYQELAELFEKLVTRPASDGGGL